VGCALDKRVDVKMGFSKRMNEAKKEMRKLAVEISNNYPNRPTDEEWADIKETIHLTAANLKHEVYGEDKEIADKRNGFGEFGHEERMMIYYDLKNEFHKTWKKLRTKIENKNEG